MNEICALVPTTWDLMFFTLIPSSTISMSVSTMGIIEAVKYCILIRFSENLGLILGSVTSSLLSQLIISCLLCSVSLSFKWKKKYFLQRQLSLFF